MVHVHLVGNDGIETVFDNNYFTVFPNPTTNFVKISGDDVKSIKIINIAGQVVYKDDDINGEVNISMKDFETDIFH